MLYRRIGSISHTPVPFDQVMDFSVIQKLAQDEKYASSKVEYESKVLPKDVQAVLDQQAVFAEEVLAEFMPLVNVPAFYANLSYRYLDESSPPELAGHGIRFVQHLRFETT
jgi:hypothetical protein